MSVKKHRKTIVLIFLWFLCCWGLYNCKSPSEPDEPFQYKASVEIIYSRDTSKINWSNGADKATLMYELFDPDPNIRSGNDQKIIGQYRYGQLEMDKIGNNRFTGFLEQVFVHMSGMQEKHVVYIQDPAIRYGDDQTSQYTGENIIISEVCQTEIVPYAPGSSGTKLKFRLIEEGGG